MCIVSPCALNAGAPPALDRLVTRCLAKNPDDRWSSAHDLLALETRAPIGVARRLSV
jgi:serine/threonine protein kinase